MVVLAVRVVVLAVRVVVLVGCVIVEVAWLRLVVLEPSGCDVTGTSSIISSDSTSTQNIALV